MTCTYTVQAELADRIERDMLIPVKGRSFLCLMRDISVQDQIIFTSHSPYMLEYTENVYCITCQEGGSVIQALEKETDEETLLPVQRGKI